MDPEKFERVEIASAAALRDWLLERHGQEDSVWLVTFKKHLPAKYVSRDEVLDELMCFGWIDGRRMKLDADRTMQLIGPRRQQAWAESYKARVARLAEAGRMHASGLRAVEAGKASGLWNAMRSVDALETPEDLAQELGARKGAAAQWDTYPPSYRRNVLRWIEGAKRPETRKKRVDTVASAAETGDRVPQF